MISLPVWSDSRRPSRIRQARRAEDWSLAATARRTAPGGGATAAERRGANRDRVAAVGKGNRVEPLDLLLPAYVLAMAAIESGWFKSRRPPHAGSMVSKFSCA